MLAGELSRAIEESWHTVAKDGLRWRIGGLAGSRRDANFCKYQKGNMLQMALKRTGFLEVGRGLVGKQASKQQAERGEPC